MQTKSMAAIQHFCWSPLHVFRCGDEVWPALRNFGSGQSAVIGLDRTRITSALPIPP